MRKKLSNPFSNERMTVSSLPEATLTVTYFITYFLHLCEEDNNFITHLFFHLKQKKDKLIKMLAYRHRVGKVLKCLLLVYLYFMQNII